MSTVCRAEKLYDLAVPVADRLAGTLLASQTTWLPCEIHLARRPVVVLNSLGFKSSGGEMV